MRQQSDCLLGMSVANTLVQMPAKELTQEQREDAQRLRSLFKAWQADQGAAGHRATQEELAELLGFGQSAISQYLNGKIPLNPDAASRFASLMGCGVSAFSPAIAGQIQAMAASAPGTPATVRPMSARAPKWPFPRIDPAKIGALRGDDAMRLEGAILLAAAQLRIDIEGAVTGKRRAA